MAEPAFERNPDRVYTTPDIAVEWESRLCIHAARCLGALPAVFDPARRPWVVLENGSADAVAAAVSRCPTGALHFRRLDVGEQEAVPERTSVTPTRNGPLFVHGNVVVQAENGEIIRHDTRMAPCRCGESQNKPFCDNSHRRTGFRAP